MKSPTLSLTNFIDRLSRLEARANEAEERAIQAEQRASRAEAHANDLEHRTANLAAAVVEPNRVSRRNLLLKAAGVGAAAIGVATIAGARPRDAAASFAITGGALNNSDGPTTLLSNTGVTANPVFKADANQAANPTTNVDGVWGVATGRYSGVVGFGGNKGGTGFYGAGGPGIAGVIYGGSGIIVFGGPNFTPSGYGTAGKFYGDGASDGTAAGYGIESYGAGNGAGVYSFGGRGTTATPKTGGGNGVQGYGGPGGNGGIFIGDANNVNPAIPAHGIFGGGNALGVGAWFAGGRAQIQMVPNAGIGAPTAGRHYHGDMFMDASEVIWICTADGIPGTFRPLQPAGFNKTLFTTVSTQQYLYTGSDGATWADMDPVNLALTINPSFNCLAILSASSDLWTAVAGLNQDIGISVAGGSLPSTAGQPEAWKESGGFAGTYSPNAAYVEAIVPLAAGTAYTVKVVWKTNKPAAGGSIYAGAGPIGGKFSPTKLTALLIATNPGGAASLPAGPAPEFKREPIMSPPDALPGTPILKR